MTDEQEKNRQSQRTRRDRVSGYALAQERAAVVLMEGRVRPPWKRRRFAVLRDADGTWPDMVTARRQSGRESGDAPQAMVDRIVERATGKAIAGVRHETVTTREFDAGERKTFRASCDLLHELVFVAAARLGGHRVDPGRQQDIATWVVLFADRSDRDGATRTGRAERQREARDGLGISESETADGQLRIAVAPPRSERRLPGLIIRAWRPGRRRAIAAGVAVLLVVVAVVALRPSGDEGSASPGSTQGVALVDGARAAAFVDAATRRPVADDEPGVWPGPANEPCGPDRDGTAFGCMGLERREAFNAHYTVIDPVGRGGRRISGDTTDGLRLRVRPGGVLRLATTATPRALVDQRDVRAVTLVPRRAATTIHVVTLVSGPTLKPRVRAIRSVIQADTPVVLLPVGRAAGVERVDDDAVDVDDLPGLVKVAYDQLGKRTPGVSAGTVPVRPAQVGGSGRSASAVELQAVPVDGGGVPAPQPREPSWRIADRCEWNSATTPWTWECPRVSASPTLNAQSRPGWPDTRRFVLARDPRAPDGELGAPGGSSSVSVVPGDRVAVTVLAMCTGLQQQPNGMYSTGALRMVAGLSPTTAKRWARVRVGLWRSDCGPTRVGELVLYSDRPITVRLADVPALFVRDAGGSTDSNTPAAVELPEGTVSPVDERWEPTARLVRAARPLPLVLSGVDASPRQLSVVLQVDAP